MPEFRTLLRVNEGKLHVSVFFTSGTFVVSMAANMSSFSSPALDGIAQTAASLPPTLELLAHYRKRIEEFEAERAEFLKRFRTVEVCLNSNNFCPNVGFVFMVRVVLA